MVVLWEVLPLLAAVGVGCKIDQVKLVQITVTQRRTVFATDDRAFFALDDSVLSNSPSTSISISFGWLIASAMSFDG